MVTVIIIIINTNSNNNGTTVIIRPIALGYYCSLHVFFFAMEEGPANN